MQILQITEYNFYLNDFHLMSLSIGFLVLLLSKRGGKETAEAKKYQNFKLRRLLKIPNFASHLRPMQSFTNEMK